VNLKGYRMLFIVGTLVVALIVASPGLATIVPLQSGSEEFSELWLLGSDHMAEGYPFNVGVGVQYKVFVGVGNHMSTSENYIVYVKLRNVTQPLSDTENSVPSSLPPLYEYRFFVDDKEVWESLVTFGFEDATVKGDVLSVGDIIVNGVAFSVDVSARWDSEGGGFAFQLFFELWRYNDVSSSFSFDNQFVGLWLNVTAS
jgi:uncharacterized membrane protein